MDKNSILQIAPCVLKRMEYGIERFYLLNFDNDEIWVGNYATYLIISRIDGKKSINEIINEVKDIMNDFSYNEIFNAIENILHELIENGFLIKNNCT